MLHSRTMLFRHANVHILSGFLKWLTSGFIIERPRELKYVLGRIVKPFMHLLFFEMWNKIVMVSIFSESPKLVSSAQINLKLRNPKEAESYTVKVTQLDRDENES